MGTGNGTMARAVVVEELFGEIAARNHFCRVIGGDVGRKEFGRPRLLHASPHGLDHLWDALVHLAKDLVPLGLIVFDEIATLPKRVAGLAKWFGLQAKFRFDD